MPPFPDLARHLRPPDTPGAPDADLLRRFAAGRDEAAFELLVWRHGGMVHAACRRVLGRSADADDAFQVTFLALARRAGSIRDGGALPGWLHRVARRAAARVKAAARRRESTSATPPEPAVEPAQPDDVGPVLDEEIDRLPEKLRRAFVLCHLEGVTNEAAAARLGCPKGTVLSRLARARERLRDRLTRRGVVAPALLVAPAAAPPAAALAAATARAAAHFAAGPCPGEIPTHVTEIARGVLRTMRLTQLRPISLVLAITALVGAGLAAAAGRPDPAPTPAAATRPAPAPQPPAPRRLALEKHDCPDVGTARFSPDGSVLVVNGAKAEGEKVEEVVTFWEAATGRHLHTVRGDDAGGNPLSFSADGKLIAIPHTGRGEVVVRDVAGGAVVRRVRHPVVYSAQFSPRGTLLLTSSGGFVDRHDAGDLRIWDATTGKEVFSPPRAADETFPWAFFARDGRLLFRSSLGRVRIWDPATGRETPPVRLDDPALVVWPSPNGDTFLTTTGGRLRLYSGATGRLLRVLGREDEAFESAGFSDDASVVVAADKAGRVTVWEAATGTRRASFNGTGGEDRGSVFAHPTPDGRYLLTQWSTPTADGTDRVSWVAAFTPDGRLVRRERGAEEVVFDTAGRAVAVITRTPATADQPPRFDVTVHDAAAWLAPPKKD